MVCERIGVTEMDKPSIKLNGRTIEMPEPKAKLWRVFAEFEGGKKDLTADQYVEQHCRMISVMYEGAVTAEELLESMALSEVIPAYKVASTFLTAMLYSKLKELEKKEESVGDGVI